MYCHKCGNKVDDNASFCNNCGIKLQALINGGPDNSFNNNTFAEESTFAKKSAMRVNSLSGCFDKIKSIIHNHKKTIGIFIIASLVIFIVLQVYLMNAATGEMKSERDFFEMNDGSILRHKDWKNGNIPVSTMETDEFKEKMIDAKWGFYALSPDRIGNRRGWDWPQDVWIQLVGEDHTDDDDLLRLVDIGRGVEVPMFEVIRWTTGEYPQSMDDRAASALPFHNTDIVSPTINATETSGVDVYHAVLGEYINYMKNDEYTNCEYVFYDIDGNGVDELITRYDEGIEDCTAIHTYANGKTYDVGYFWPRYYLMLDGNGGIYADGDDGMAHHTIEAFRISDDGSELIVVESWEMEGPVYSHYSVNGLDVISAREYNAAKGSIYDATRGFVDSLEWQPLLGANGRKPESENTSPIGISYKGNLISDLMGTSLANLRNVFGNPEAEGVVGEGGYGFRYVDIVFFKSDQGEDIINISGKPSSLSIDGVSLDTNRDQLVRFFGNPIYEEWGDEGYYAHIGLENSYTMQFAYQEDYLIFFELDEPNGKAWSYSISYDTNGSMSSSGLTEDDALDIAQRFLDDHPLYERTITGEVEYNPYFQFDTTGLYGIYLLTPEGDRRIMFVDTTTEDIYISPDGSYLLTGEEFYLTLYNEERGKDYEKNSLSSNPVTADGNVLSVGSIVYAKQNVFGVTVNYVRGYVTSIENADSINVAWDTIFENRLWAFDECAIVADSSSATGYSYYSNISHDRIQLIGIKFNLPANELYSTIP